MIRTNIKLLKVFFIALLFFNITNVACKKKRFCMPTFDAVIVETQQKFKLAQISLSDISIWGNCVIDSLYYFLNIEFPDTCRTGIKYSFQDTMINAYYGLDIIADTVYNKYSTEIITGELILIYASSLFEDGYEAEFNMQFTDETGDIKTIENGYINVCIP